MDIFDLITMFGGLAMFLFGMSIMGEGLERQASGKFKNTLEKLTNSPFKGLLLGIGVTAVIQSSSATTVMVVGFVNSGIMKLEQAIGVIMGANIGTTVTAWLLSLTGIEGDSFFINLLKPSSFAPILAVVGIILYMAGKTTKRKDIGMVFVGFAILMFGMQTMSSAVKPLSSEPWFAEMFVKFTNPILGVLVGAVLTGIIQSSSASVGILQALSVTGAVSYASAVPIIMGQNIGTCVTTLISSIGANKNARRASIIHLYFNIIGTILFLAIFYSLNAIFKFEFLEGSIDAVGIAVVHSAFNLLATAIMLPFIKQFEKLTYLTIPQTEEREEATVMLDERLLSTPALAIGRCTQITEEMADCAVNTYNLAVGLLDKYDEGIAAEVIKGEDKLDKYEDHLGSYLVKLSACALNDSDSHEVFKLLHIIGDLERIGDHALNLHDSANELHDKNIVFTPEAADGLKVMQKAVSDILGMAVASFHKRDLSLAAHIEPLEEVVDVLKTELRDQHILRLQQGKCTIETGFVFSDIITNYERISDHCSNIAICLIEVEQDSFDTHAHLGTVKHGDAEFTKEYKRDLEQYPITHK